MKFVQICDSAGDPWLFRYSYSSLLALAKTTLPLAILQHKLNTILPIIRQLSIFLLSIASNRDSKPPSQDTRSGSAHTQLVHPQFPKRPSSPSLHGKDIPRSCCQGRQICATLHKRCTSPYTCGFFLFRFESVAGDGTAATRGESSSGGDSGVEPFVAVGELERTYSASESGSDRSSPTWGLRVCVAGLSCPPSS